MGHKHAIVLFNDKAEGGDLLNKQLLLMRSMRQDLKGRKVAAEEFFDFASSSTRALSKEELLALKDLHASHVAGLSDAHPLSDSLLPGTLLEHMGTLIDYTQRQNDAACVPVYGRLSHGDGART